MKKKDHKDTMNDCNVRVDLNDWLEQSKYEAAESLRKLSRKDLKDFYEIVVDLFGKPEADSFFDREELER